MSLVGPAIVTVVAIVIIVRAVKVVPEGNVYVVERLGRYFGTLPAGMHLVLPFVDRIAYRYSLLPREEEISETAITLDNVPVRVTSVLRAQIRDAQQAAYASANAGDSLQTLVRTHQRQWMAERSWKDVRERELEAAVMRAASEPAKQLGVELLALDVKNIERET
jgi:regulator of protease activity HflC (stomatin/prohibitin superfamily)